jgi:hypothetical protein
MPNKEEIREFSLLIEKLAFDLRCNRLDAILEHCKRTGMEIEVAGTLISQALKVRLKEEAQDMNMIRRNSKLPV